MKLLLFLFLCFSVQAQTNPNNLNLPENSNTYKDTPFTKEIELPPRANIGFHQENAKSSFSASKAKNFEYINFLKYYLAIKNDANQAIILWELSNPEEFTLLKNSNKKHKIIKKYQNELSHTRDENFILSIGLKLGKYDEFFHKFTIKKINASNNFEYKIEALSNNDFYIHYQPNPNIIPLIKKYNLPKSFGLKITNNKELRFLHVNEEMANVMIAMADYTSTVNCSLELGTPAIIKNKLRDSKTKRFLSSDATYHFRYKRIKCFEDRSYKTQITLSD